MFARLRRLCSSSRIPGIVALFASVALIALFTSVPSSGAPGAGHPAYASAPPTTFTGGITPAEEAARMADLHGWLMQQMPAGVTSSPLLVGLTDQERADLQRRQGTPNGPEVVGRTKPITEVVRFSGPAAALLSASPVRVGHGVLQGTDDGGFVWAMAIESQGAGALRVHIGGLDLPPDADLFFFNQAGQAFGPYSKKGPNADGQFWTDTVFGSTGIVLLRHYGPNGAADLKGISFNISDVGHIGPKFAQDLTAATESFCSFNASCVLNASCGTTSSIANPAKSAVALMQWISGAYIYTCTGGLITDSSVNSAPYYFLTAHHCISKGRDAQNLQLYFQFSISCGSTNCPPQTQPGGIQRLGSSITATGTGGDYTLLSLNQAPPGGSVFLGWNSTPIANTNNAALYRISHPAWAPQAYSAHRVDTSAPTCTGWPRGERIYSRDTAGATEGGSSGSPVLNSASEIVGQLSGACGTNVNDSCDSTHNATVDGAFAYYYSSVASYLGTSCTPSTEICNDGIDNDCDGLIDCFDTADCSTAPNCTSSCFASGHSCSSNSDCCSNNCKGPKNNKTCR
jgi:V8-like Glu-specific endopeptidase